MLCYLRLIANPDDDAAFLRVVNVPKRDIGATTLEKLGRTGAARKHSSLLRAARSDSVLRAARAAPGDRAGLRSPRLIDEFAAPRCSQARPIWSS